MSNELRVRSAEDRIFSDNINLLDYWELLCKKKLLLALLVMVSVLTTSFYSLTLPNIYKAEATIRLGGAPTSEGGGGAVGGGIQGMLIQQMLASTKTSTQSSGGLADINMWLNSDTFMKVVIEKYNLLPFLFPEMWDADRNEWKKGSGEKAPGGSILKPKVLKQKVIGAFVLSIKKILGKDTAGQPIGPVVAGGVNEGGPTLLEGVDALKGLVKLTGGGLKSVNSSIVAEYKDPLKAKRLVEIFIEALNEHMSNVAREDARNNMKYLEYKLETTLDPFIKSKIYGMIASELANEMFSDRKDSFAFKVIDPPRVPKQKMKPDRFQMVQLSFVISLIGGIFLIFFLEYIKKMKRAREER